MDHKYIIRDKSGNVIKARTDGQSRMVDEIMNKTIVFVDGPAGTGKTFLAAALAGKHLKEGKVDKVVMSRPAVEAGERLGFLPGTLEEKIDPYLRPLYDSLEMLFTFEEAVRLQHNKQVEVVPIAFMRGRTLRNSFLILDEAQNTTPMQMKMFLTRIGDNSKMVVVGDSTQKDIGNNYSGFADALNKLQNVKDVGIVKLDRKDVVRADIVGKIIDAYDG